MELGDDFTLDVEAPTNLEGAQCQVFKAAVKYSLQASESDAH